MNRFTQPVSKSIDSPDHVVVLTGAGVSAESGVPTFRGEGGLWRNFRPEQLATWEAFQRDPELVWEWYDWRRQLIAACEPNAAHRTLAEMEASFSKFTLITQNVDGLHQAAGSQNVLELHGNIWRVRCTGCGNISEDHRVPLPDFSPRCEICGELLRPDVVWFGEVLPFEIIGAALEAATNCQLMLVIGTSALVHPAASLPMMAMESGAHIIEVNPTETPLSRHAQQILREPAAEALPPWWKTYQAEGKV